MNTKFFNLILACVSASAFSQVGINTANPTATLDINGTVKIREAPLTSTLSGYQILAIDQGSSQAYTLNPETLINASATNSTVYAAKKSNGISLVALGGASSGYRAVNFTTAERTLGSAALFSDATNTYNIPSAGVYLIGYTFRYGSGLQSALLANSPGIGIIRIRNNTPVIIDSRSFSGINLSLVLSLTISEAGINSLYSLQAGDRISFGLTGSSSLDAGILGSSTGSFYIYKVSN